MKKLIVSFGLGEDGELMNGHYGDSEKFALYEFREDGTYELIEYRENQAKEMEEDEEHEHHGDPNKFRAVISQLQDVDVLAGYWFGPNLRRIRQMSNKVVFFTKTRSLKEAIEKVKQNFNQIYEERQEKMKSVNI
ncbi:MAG: NifB/NifX family molybdenum-iron cluster-binding protein [Candidatus Njordarchaeia archaeon]